MSVRAETLPFITGPELEKFIIKDQEEAPEMVLACLTSAAAYVEDRFPGIPCCVFDEHGMCAIHDSLPRNSSFWSQQTDETHFYVTFAAFGLTETSVTITAFTQINVNNKHINVRLHIRVVSVVDYTHEELKEKRFYTHRGIPFASPSLLVSMRRIMYADAVLSAQATNWLVDVREYGRPLVREERAARARFFNRLQKLEAAWLTIMAEKGLEDKSPLAIPDFLHINDYTRELLGYYLKMTQSYKPESEFSPPKNPV